MGAYYVFVMKVIFLNLRRSKKVGCSIFGGLILVVLTSAANVRAVECASNDYTKVTNVDEEKLLEVIRKYRESGYDMSQLYTLDEENPVVHIWLNPEFKNAYNPTVGSYEYEVPGYRLCVRLKGLDCGPGETPEPGKFGVNYKCPSYQAALPKENPPSNCSAAQAPTTVGNPIKIATGEKIQVETIDFEGLPIRFAIASQLSGSAINPIQKTDEIRVQRAIAFSDTSQNYGSRKEACQAGLREFQVKHVELQNLTAEYICNNCLLKKGDQVVAGLGVGRDGSFDGITQFKRQDGSLTNYVSKCEGKYQSAFGAGHEPTLTQENGGWRLRSSGQQQAFDQFGKLTEVADGSGNPKYSYTYSPQGITAVKNAQGQEYLYNQSNGQLNSIQAPSGKMLQFNYQGGSLTKIIFPNQTERRYHYEDTRFPNNLTGITDERGVRFATWKYDDKGRAISSEHAGGAEKTTLAFNTDGSTTVTNALGKKTTFSFTDILGVRRVTNVTGEPTASCVGANQAYTYTPQGQVETKTDWNGTVTRFTYDSFGRELTKTQAYGTADAKTIQTCWHEPLNQTSRVIEATKITLFDYTPAGQLKSQVVKSRPVGAVDCATAL